MKLQEIWVSADSQKFQIIKLEKRDQNDWVIYSKLSTGQTYSCRLESFKERFTRETNG